VVHSVRLIAKRQRANLKTQYVNWITGGRHMTRHATDRHAGGQTVLTERVCYRSVSLDYMQQQQLMMGAISLS